MTVDLEAIRARLAAATPRPWVFNGYSRVDSEPLLAVSDDAPDYPSEMRPYSLWQISRGEQGAPYPSPEDEAWLDQFDAAYHADPEVASVLAHHGDTATGRHRADAELIAHAPDDLEALLALVEAREQEIVRLRAVVEQFGRRDHLVNCAVRAPVWVDARRGEAIVTVCYLCQMPYEEHCQPHPCSCGADVHNAAIDAALGKESSRE